MPLRRIEERYWFQTGDEMRILDGFLPTASTFPSEGLQFMPDLGLLKRSDLVNKKNLAVLGQPGSGKSDFLRRNQPLLPERVGAEPIFLDLTSYGSEDRLVTKLSQVVTQARANSATGEIVLTMDSFDEAQQRIPHLASVLIQELEALDPDELWLRIGCRTSEWPSILNTWFAGRSDSLVAELAPFTREDVKNAAGEVDDPEAFVRLIESRGLAPLAAMPLSLDLLLRSYEAPNELPQSRVAVYTSGVRAMCEEHSSQRHRSRRAGPAPSDILRAGETTAALMIFTAKERLWTGPITEAEATDLTIDELVLAGRTEDGRPELDAECFVLMSQTALFQGSGGGRLTWAHTTFQEYLAARWCISHIQTRPRIYSLLFAPDQKIFPVMRRLAAWLISMDPTAYAWIGEADPEAVAGEIDVPDENLRANVVRALIEHAKTGLHVRDWETNYSHLKHAGLGHQLGPAIASGPEDSRLLAIQIAREAQVTDVEGELLNIATDPEQSERLRYHSIVTLGDLGYRGRALTAVLEDPRLLGEDAKRELRGAIIDASWPHDLSTADALRHLAVSAPSWLIGHYSLAIGRIARGLTDRDFEASAEWLGQEVADTEWFDELRNATLAVCADHIDNATAQQSAVSAVRRRLAQNEAVFGTHGHEVSWPSSRRRALLLVVADSLTDEELFALVSESKTDGLLHPEDFPWLVEELEDASDQRVPILLELLHHMFTPDRFDHANTLASLPQDHPLVAGALAHWCGYVDLDSPNAATQRESWRKWNRPNQTERTAKDIEDPVECWINSNLEKFDGGDLRAFAHALLLVTVPPGASRYRAPFQPDLTTHPRWKALSTVTQQAIISRVPAYLTSASCQPEIWDEDDLSTASAQAAYRSMILLLRTGDQLDSLPATTWEEWAPGIMSWRPAINGASQSDHEHLIRKAKPHAQGSLIRALLDIIRIDIRSQSTSFVAQECALLWSTELSTGLATLLSGGVNSASLELATILLRHDPENGRAVLNAWIVEGSEKATGQALECLLAHDAHVSWPVIRKLLTERPEVSKEAILNLADRENTDPNMTDEQLAFLHSWLEKHFPREEDPDISGAHAITAREMVTRWRDRLLEVLIGRGTEASVEALRIFAREQPQEAWRMSALARALRSRREAAWQPLDPGVLAEYGRDISKRLARSNHELLEVVVSALVRIQERLTGETPESHLLWDTRVMRPKSEDEASDYLLHRLRDLVAEAIINREVQVRRNAPSGIPERADLLIEAVTAGERNLRVVVESKGAWSDELLTAIDSQLIGRYMADFRPAAGIYIVLWPDAGSWASDQGRQDRARLINMCREDVIAQIEEQVESARLHDIDIAAHHLDMDYKRPTAEGSQ